jgi:hypothetical protein
VCRKQGFERNTWFGYDLGKVPDDGSNKSVMLDKQTMRVGSVAAVLAFLLGLSFAFGGKSASVDALSTEVRDMRNDIKTLTMAINTKDGETHDAITALHYAVEGLQKQVDEINAKADYRAAGGTSKR